MKEATKESIIKKDKEQTMRDIKEYEKKVKEILIAEDEQRLADSIEISLRPSEDEDPWCEFSDNSLHIKQNGDDWLAFPDFYLKEDMEISIMSSSLINRRNEDLLKQAKIKADNPVDFNALSVEVEALILDFATPSISEDGELVAVSSRLRAEEIVKLVKDTLDGKRKTGEGDIPKPWEAFGI